MMWTRVNINFLILVGMLTFLSSCNHPPRADVESSQRSRHLKVVTTTTIIGDVVHNIGREAIDLHVLLPIGTDPHSFEPTPQDMAMLAEAEIVFMNGAGLEEFMDTLLQNAGGGARLVRLSEDIELLKAPNGEELGIDGHEGGDPHVWMDPNNVMIWVDKIENTLSELDEDNAAMYLEYAAKYRQALAELDKWVHDQVAQVLEANRILVTDHQFFGYFADRYGFRQVGTVAPGYSTIAEPSAQELAELEDTIRRLGVRAVFVGRTVNPSLAERVSEDTGVQLVFLYTGSLSGEGGPAATYLDYIRFNVASIVAALK